MLDIHCHLMVFGESTKGFLHPSFQKSLQVRTYLNNVELINQWELLWGTRKDAVWLTEEYKRTLREQIIFSTLDHVVVLALDGIYKNGELDKEKTMWYVSNDAVIDLAKTSQKILLGASINPLRRDWKDELAKCIEAKIALVKWLPSMMGFNPNNKQLQPFYERLVEKGIPLLTHVGFEFAVPTIDNTYSQLENIILPLDIGVKVIAAHCCGGRPLLDNREDFKNVVSLTERYSHLYLDVAGMASFHRKSRLKNALSNKETKERIIYGSDYPIPVHPWAFLPELGINYQLPENLFDKDKEIKRATGMEAAALSRGYSIIPSAAFSH